MTVEGRSDFFKVIGKINRLMSDVAQLVNPIDELTKIKIEIMDDPVKLAEVKKYIDLDETLTKAKILASYNKLIDLRQYLQDNGFLD